MTIPTPPTDKAVPASESVMRILNGVALALIGLSVLAQCLRYILMYTEAGNNGLTPGGFLGLIGFAIIPGMLLAFAKLILNVFRSFKNAKARPKAAMYFLIVMLPFVLPVILMTAPSRSMETVMATQQAKPEESEQFIAGREWAKVNNPIHNTQCKGTHEFNRGCWNRIDLRRKAQRKEGYEWARQNLPEKENLCQGAPYFVLGCRTYFVEHLRKPKPAGTGKYEGMTTAECVEEVNGNYEAGKAIDLEHENFHSIEVTYRRSWAPELKDCENYDRHVDSNFMPGAYARLESAIDRLKAGQIVPDDEKATVLKDFTNMSKIREQPYTVAYMKRFEEYSKRLNGEYKEPVIDYPQISCSQYQAKINEMIRLDRERSDAMLALKRPDGGVGDSAEHSRLNQQRIDMMWDWKLYTDGANKAGCKIVTK
jgi:hypothetical protein